MTISNKLKVFLVKWKEKTSVQDQKRALVLLSLQIAMIFLFSATLIFIFNLDFGYRRIFYFWLITGLILFLGVALILSLSGKYKAAAFLTILCISIGPWASILLDNKIINGDIVPLVYTVITINLCAIFLSEKVTVIIAMVQLISLIALIQSSPYLMQENWPSLITYVIFSAMIGIVTSVITRKQLEQIEAQKAKLLDNEEQLRSLSIRDPLTGLFNRRYMEETLEREIERALRNKQSLGIIMTDIDNFKLVNDTYGHAIGDNVLIQVSNIINTKTRGADIACRFGGDEIILILPDCTLESTFIKAEEIRNAINNITITNDGNNLIKITLSFGVSALPENGLCGKDVLIAADKALYVAKKEGRNRVVSAPVICI